MRKASILFAVLLLGLVAGLGYAQAPVPFINQPLVPDATAPGGPQFTLTVNGTGFVSNSTVNWNGSPLATTFASGSQLTAIVPATDIATASTGWVTVVNPAPGGGTSNVAFFTVTTSPGDSVAFTLATFPAVGSYQSAVAVADFNRDGKLDLAVANYYSNTVSILLGDGTGNFTLASSPSTGLGPNCLVVGDFNGDGKPDLAVANYDDGTVSILLGDGMGNFTLASSPAAGPSAASVAVGDFNGDGKLGLAVADPGNASVYILLGDGTGDFTVASFPALGYAPTAVAVGDFNGDGKLDLAVANAVSNAIFIFLGDGAGNFTLVSSIPVGTYPNSLAVGDFNGDGKLDLAVADRWADELSILLGDGTGNFTLVSSPPTGLSPLSVAVGDFNGDGILDLAVSNSGSFSPSVLLGDGTGNFTLVSSPHISAASVSVAVGDFNGDGKLDLATADWNFDTVSILLQAGPAATLSPASLSFGTQLFGTTSGPQTVTLTNTGGETLNITSIAPSANFAETNTCGSDLAAGASCTITVTFTPQGLGTLTGVITITDNASNSPQTVSLTGIGTAVGLRPTSLNFGNQKVGTTSSPRTVNLTNRGNQAVSIAGIRFTGADAGDFAQTNTCGSSVPAGGNCSFSVTFSPKAKGSRTATMGIAAGTVQTVALSGAGT